MKRTSHIYPIFLPHAGCPFQCIYCNQHLVTRSEPDIHGGEDGLIRIVQDRLHEHAKRACKDPCPGEIAFYGGTFTALKRETMAAILDESSQWVHRKAFSGIRFSTRPDCMSHPVCLILKDYPIQTVELGVQSFSDEVLDASGRGYPAVAAENAARLVKNSRWNLGIQLMPGLPEDTRERFLASVETCVAVGADFVRLYPSLVLERTALVGLHRTGRYVPLSLEEAVSWCAQAYEELGRSGIPLARAGLHGDPELERPGAIVAGPYHPAFGYLVRVRWWRERVDRLLSALSTESCGRFLTVFVPRNLISEAIGPGRANVNHWKSRWAVDEIQILGRADWTDRRLEVIVH